MLHRTVAMHRKTLIRGGAAVALAGAMVGAWAHWVEPAWIETTSIELDWSGPPLRVVLLADLHAEPHSARRTARIVRRTRALSPDLVLFAGDFVSGLRAPPSILRSLAPLARLRAPLGVFAVLGNHDSEPEYEDAVARAVARAGVRILDNENVRLPGGAALVGLGSHRAGEDDPARAFSGVSEGTPAIVLVHNFRSLELPGASRFDLALAGHTHGGQGCVPFTEICPFLEDDMKPFTRGLYDWPRGGRLYVSRGLGTSGVAARIGARPEIASITLRRSSRSTRA